MDMTVVFPGGSRVDAICRDFVIPTDQPVRAGGEGGAPAPFDYFIASLATCAGLYVLSFLQRRSLPTEDVRLVVKTTKDHDRGLVSDVEMRVVLPGGFPSKYRNAIIKAVDLCAVKQHLVHPPRIGTVVEIGGRVVPEDGSLAQPTEAFDRDPR